MRTEMVLGPDLVDEASLVLITAPTVRVITAAEARTMLALSDSTPDAMIEAMIDAVTGTIDPATRGWLGRALRPQTWELRLDCFPGERIDIPYPVLTELTSIKYDSTAGVETTMVENTDYRVFGLGGHDKAYVTTIYNGTWPTPRADDESVRIRFVAGYAGVAMPQAIKSAVALGVKHLISTGERSLYIAREDIPGVRSRQYVVSEAAGKAIETAIGGLLAPFRVWG